MISRWNIILFVGGAALPAAERVDYLREVKPLLTQHCVRCHSEAKEEGGLRLDTASNAFTGGDSGPAIKSGNKKSLLLTVIRDEHPDIPRMPYKKPALSPAEVAVLQSWILEGATSPEDEVPGRAEHWAYVPPKRPVLPAVKQRDWPKVPIDRFILVRLEQEGVAPSPEADRVTLLRRVSLDLTGLPPTPQDVAAFVADTRPDAYERRIEQLLASPHFGERWARPWLDVARYADSNGYSIDRPRQIWKYRDWVVSALNRDLPYDQFVVEQLAGDLLPNATIEQKVATGFNRNTQINQEGGIDSEQFRVEAVLDRVNTFGTAFLGLTVGCAQCHDHKFDPISQKEYYQLYAFFNNTEGDGHGREKRGGILQFSGESINRADREEEVKGAREELETYLSSQSTDVIAWIKNLDTAARKKLRANVRAALEVPWEKQSLEEKRLVYGAFRGEGEFRDLNNKLAELEGMPTDVTTLVMSELPQPRESFIFVKGDFTRRGDQVLPGTPAVLPPLRAEKPNRLDLARWVVDPQNPLVARVIVNRIWQQYFSRGLVETENDFGSQGSAPSHPELLDWLATEFVGQQWSWKALHKLIVTSATYRQSSRVRPDLEMIDPLNNLLARQFRLRLDAELIRDLGLSASGLLLPKLGGPPVFPPQPEGVMNLGQAKRNWRVSPPPDRYRRGLYTHFWRATPHPALAVFDAADGFSSCTRRLRSNTPLQALTLLNDEQFYEFAVALANRVQREAQGDLAKQLTYAFQLCVARGPTADERERLANVFREELAAASGDEAARRQVAWTTVARVLLNLDETITRE